MRSTAFALVLALMPLVGAAEPGALAAPQDPAAADLARRIQTRYDAVKSFRADFRQTVSGAFLRTAPESRGEVLVLKPGRVRWTYKKGPTGRGQNFQVVSDGRTLYLYWPNDKLGEERPVPTGNDAPLSMLFLSGMGDLLRDFSATVPAPQPAGEYRLTLTPKKPQADFATLTLIVARDTLALKGLITTQAQGETSTFEFTNLRENVALTARDFAFSFPAGTRVNR